MHCGAASPEHTCHRAACTSGLGRAAWGQHPPWVGVQSWGQRCTLSTVARPPPTSVVRLQRHAKVCCSLLLHLSLGAEVVLAKTMMYTECAGINCSHHSASLELVKLYIGAARGKGTHNRLLMTILSLCLRNLSAQHCSSMNTLRTPSDTCPTIQTPPNLSGLCGLTHKCQKACPIRKTRWNKSCGKQVLEDARTYTCPSGRSLA